MTNPHPSSPAPARPKLNEDWLAILIALLIVLLSAAGLLGPQGIKIIF